MQNKMTSLKKRTHPQPSARGAEWCRGCGRRRRRSPRWLDGTPPRAQALSMVPEAAAVSLSLEPGGVGRNRGLGHEYAQNTFPAQTRGSACVGTHMGVIYRICVLCVMGVIYRHTQVSHLDPLVEHEISTEPCESPVVLGRGGPPSGPPEAPRCCGQHWNCRHSLCGEKRHQPSGKG